MDREPSTIFEINVTRCIFDSCVLTHRPMRRSGTLYYSVLPLNVRVWRRLGQNRVAQTSYGKTDLREQERLWFPPIHRLNYIHFWVLNTQLILLDSAAVEWLSAFIAPYLNFAVFGKFFAHCHCTQTICNDGWKSNRRHLTNSICFLYIDDCTS